MNVFPGHNTACAFWRTASDWQVSTAVPCHSLPSSKTTRKPKEARTLTEGTAFQGWPLHLELPPNLGAKGSPEVRFHETQFQPYRAYRKIARDVYMASPETTFIQMASELSLGELVLFGNELCGTYRKSAFVDGGLEPRSAVTSVHALRAAVNSMDRFVGHRKAAQAVRYITNNTNSPMESVFAAKFSLLKRYGGCQFPSFSCNEALLVPSEQQHLIGKALLRPDFLWAKQKLIVEYNGAEFHAGALKEAGDRRRTNFLGSLGFDVLEITRLQGTSQRGADQALEEIASHLKAPWKSRSSSWPELRWKLHDELLHWALAAPMDLLRDSI